MTNARDIRFSGTDERLLRLAEALGIDLRPLDARTLPEAVAAAVIRHGLPDSADARELFAELLRADAQAPRDPVRLSANEELKRRRLLLLGEELLRWAHRVGAELRQGRHHVRKLRGLDAVYREVARREGTPPESIKHWCMNDSDAKHMIEVLRPVERYATHPLQGHWR